MKESQPKIEKKKTMDELLDERFILAKELERLGGKLENEKVNHSEEGNKEEQLHDKIEKISDGDRISLLIEEIKKIDDELKRKTAS